MIYNLTTNISAHNFTLQVSFGG